MGTQYFCLDSEYDDFEIDGFIAIGIGLKLKTEYYICSRKPSQPASVTIMLFGIQCTYNLRLASF